MEHSQQTAVVQTAVIYSVIEADRLAPSVGSSVSPRDEELEVDGDCTLPVLVVEGSLELVSSGVAGGGLAGAWLSESSTSDGGVVDESSGEGVPDGAFVGEGFTVGGWLFVGDSDSLSDGEVEALGLFVPVGLSLSLWLGVGLVDFVGVGRGFGAGMYGVSSSSGTMMSGSGALLDWPEFCEPLPLGAVFAFTVRRCESIIA